MALSGPITSSQADLLLTSPVRFPLEGFVANHKLAVSLVSNVLTSGDLEIQISVYLRQREVPFEILSNVYNLDYGEQTNTVP